MKKIINIFIACFIIALVGCSVDSNEHEEEAKTPSSSSISTKAENNASASEVTEASGVSSGRNVSGFDTKSNKTIIWGGINFSFPSYFDVLDEGSTEKLMHYYPEEKDYYASIVFESVDFSGTQKDFNSQIPSIVESERFANIEIQKSEGISIAGLPGWEITFFESDTNGDGVASTGSYSFVYNIDTEKVVIFSCSYDSNDKSQYDYSGDCQKVLKTAKLFESTKVENNESANKALEAIFSVENAKRSAVVAITNAYAIDVFKEDRDTYDI